MTTSSELKPSGIELTEHKVSEPKYLTVQELLALHTLIPNLKAKPIEEGQYELNPGGSVGAGSIEGRPVYVSPKFDVSNLLFLVGYASDPFEWRSALAHLKKTDDFLGAMAALFSKTVSDAITRGLLKAYRTHEEPLQTVRGRIDFSSLIKNRHGLIPPIDCEFDDFTEDVQINRLIKAALRTLLRLDRLDQEVRRELHGLLLRFGHVRDVRYSKRSIPKITFTRLNRQFKSSVELAKLILRDTSLDLEAGGIEVKGFFLNVATVFEQFVLVALREALELSENQFPEKPHPPLTLDISETLGLEPDLSWWESGKCVFVGDAKYKETPPTAGVKSPDVYQLLAYTQATDLDWGLLLYAKGEAKEAEYKIRNSNKSFQVMTLDLNKPPKEILRDIDEVAAHITLKRAKSDQFSAHGFEASEPTFAGST